MKSIPTLAPFCRVPPCADGVRIGLFGGSFNPPHQAHRAASLFALKRLQLDFIWWLVSPGNPLKSPDGLASLKRRAEAAQALAHHPRIVVTCLEAVIGTRYTDDTIAFLTRRCPAAHFVWIMGADNLRQFHHWQNWQTLARRVPIAVIDRPPHSLAALASPAAQRLAAARCDERDCAQLADRTPPAWIFLHGLKLPLSSTALRQAGQGLAD